LSVDVTALGAGPYHCQVTVSDPCAFNSPQMIDVYLTVQPPVIEVSSQQFGFVGELGGPNPPEQILTVRNSGAGTLNWQITEDCDWLSAVPDSGISTGEVNDVALSADITGLSIGTYNCVLTISDPNAQNNPETVSVTLEILGPSIEVSSSQFVFAAEPNGPNPADQILTIRNSGAGTLNWQITEDCDWLSAEPNSGSSTGEVNDVALSVDMEGLVEGTYNCALIVSDPCAANSPQTVRVYLGIHSDINGLVSWWQFDEGAGTMAFDSFGTNHGTLNGDPCWVAGPFGAYALDFDGDGDHIRIPDADSLNPPNAITIAWWVRRRAGQGAGIFKYAHCPDSSGSPGNSRAYSLVIDELTGKVRLRIHSSVSSNDSIESNPVVTLNQWHHVAATFDAGSAAVYIGYLR
ncbi:MAG: BACON domain-containing protein, partial [Planctomycetota bacterium]